MSNFWRMVTPVVKNLIIINTVILLGTMLIGDKAYEYLALFPFESHYFKGYQMVTHMFMHGGFWHLFFNMYTLMIFGTALERMWGGKKFLLFYFVTGLGAALCHNLVLHLQIEHFTAIGETAKAAVAMATPTVGASGAIYGVLLGYAMLFPNHVLQLIFPPVAMKAKWFVIIFGAIELLTGITGMGGNIAHFAHLGGMLFGLLLILYWKKKNRMYY
ncbi:MAG: rhomboid family intramembrane serine protease [Bacteroidales bacterium]|jgi:membrane associated rhomboid family serine protease|nr:rhomboid family intramembrane serine protease [Bacteroidales bacterium]MBR7027352.1 rhomboid family intramembrane serine protease [Bacteroidales bacterium]